MAFETGRKPMAVLGAAVMVTASLIGAGRAAAQARSGPTWTTSALAAPQPGPKGLSFTSVSCPTPTWCAAVGYQAYRDAMTPTGSPSFAALAGVYIGGKWRTSTPPEPARAYDVVLTSVSCAATGSCVAVGYGPGPIAEILSGGRWHLQRLPAPPGAGTPGVVAISCRTSTSCVAVGEDSESGAGGLFADTDTGGTWTATQLPPPAGDMYPSISDVSCWGGGCVAVGATYHGTDTVALAETLSGAAWSATTLPLPGAQTYESLTAVSCYAAGGCVAVGADGSANVAESLNSGTWTHADLPVAAGASVGGETDISCADATDCTAVGSYSLSPSSLTPFALTQKAATWSQATVGRGSAPSQLLGVSCAGGACFAVGDIQPATSQAVQHLLVADNAGSGWATSQPPGPPGPPLAALATVSCQGSVAACTAVGSFTDSSGDPELMAETESAGGWVESSIPVVGQPQMVTLSGLSCPSTGDCVAAGSAYFTSVSKALVANETGGTWTSKTLVLPKGSNGGALSSVSCPEVGTCIAVGYRQTAKGAENPIIATLSGGRWAVQLAPVPAGAAVSQLFSVSCPDAKDCYAVGAGGLLEILTGGATWSGSILPGPTGTIDGGLTGVSCPAAGSCVAIGSADTSSGANVVVYAAALSGGTWSQSSVPAAGTSVRFYDLSISCASAGACVAAGSYSPARGFPHPVAYRLSTGAWHISAFPSDPTQVGRALGGVSCTAPTSCLAVGGETGFAPHPGSRPIVGVLS